MRSDNRAACSDLSLFLVCTVASMPHDSDSRTSYRVAVAADQYVDLPEGLSQHTHSGAAPSNDFNRMYAARQTQTVKEFK